MMGRLCHLSSAICHLRVDRENAMSRSTQLWGSPTRRWRSDAGGKAAIGPRPPGVARPGTGARILFVNQYYWPDHASTAQHLTDLAEALVAKGYRCDVLCSRGGY